ncbi:hypothetical protein MSG28_004396 [Choristoneura fumiferana]|uniref:Uncharacterized protein n=1 Tax=Choristoneura fumiferana TaxID=7141 RepID=A0ACC0KJE2_CHOFU|nr:hypothetical protein MSG28_004396 [Choristoneura fumiferana]
MSFGSDSNCSRQTERDKRDRAVSDRLLLPRVERSAIGPGTLQDLYIVIPLPLIFGVGRAGDLVVRVRVVSPAGAGRCINTRLAGLQRAAFPPRRSPAPQLPAGDHTPYTPHHSRVKSRAAAPPAPPRRRAL